MTDAGPTPIPVKKFEQKDLVTCLESVKSFMVAAEESISSGTSQVIGALAACSVDYVKPEGQQITE